MLVRNLVNQWKLARNSRIICEMQQTKSFKFYMFTCKHQAWDLSWQSTSNSPITYQHPLFMKSFWSCLKLLLIYLLELGFAFENSLPRGQVFGKWSCNYSFDRNANWHMKHSICYFQFNSTLRDFTESDAKTFYTILKHPHTPTSPHPYDKTFCTILNSPSPLL